MIIIAAVFVVAGVIAALVVTPTRRRRRLPGGAPPRVAGRPGVDFRPGVGDDAEPPRDTPTRTVGVLDLPQDVDESGGGVALAEPPPAPPGPGVREAGAPAYEVPAPTAGRLVRLRARLSRSQSTLGRGLLALLSRDVLDEDAWEEIEDLLITSDLGVSASAQVVRDLRERVRVLGVRTPDGVRELLREELLRIVRLDAPNGADADRTLHTLPHEDRPAVVLVVGVNGTGKTTTCGKLARVLVADGRSVLLGAADTFRAAAADQLETWGARVGAPTVRGPEGSDPASVAYDAVTQGIADRVDTVLIDTAGRLHTKTGLMDELRKVKRVVEKHGPIDETLLVLDATTGQNGVVQARVFTEAVDVTGIVLTKLDGTAKGGIVVAVQRELGIPVKLIGLGEGPDDLAPFEPEAFVDALLAEPATS